MAITGIQQRFKGKIKAATLILGKGGIVDAASEIAGYPVMSQQYPLAVTAVTTTDFGPFSLPLGAALLHATVYTGTAFTAVTDCKISIGVSAGDQSYVAQTSVKAVGVVALALVAAAAAALGSLPAPPNLFVRLTQSGGNTAVGAAVLVLEYALVS